tara:strand:+ start:378 stop:1265 length:888 start_codon:yes stop_codon:yes gene_type:complete
MSLHHKILNHLSPILKNVFEIGVNTKLISSDRLRVLTFHDIPESQILFFKSQILILKKNWTIISPAKFEKMISGLEPIKGNNILITFDDGLISNRKIAELVLKPLKIKAIFFVISDFVNIDNLSEARQFIANNIMPGININDVPINWGNMQWNDLSALLEQGHTIGSHSKTHARLSDLKTSDQLSSEIVSSSKDISYKLGNDVNHFSFPFGNFESIGKKAFKIASHNYKFIHTGLRGNNRQSLSPLLVRRDAAGSQNDNNEYSIFENELLDSILLGTIDFRYKKSLKELESWNQY